MHFNNSFNLILISIIQPDSVRFPLFQTYFIFTPWSTIWTLNWVKIIAFILLINFHRLFAYYNSIIINQEFKFKSKKHMTHSLLKKWKKTVLISEKVIAKKKKEKRKKRDLLSLSHQHHHTTTINNGHK